MASWRTDGLFAHLKGAAQEAFQRLSPDVQLHLEKALNRLSPLPFTLRLEGDDRYVVLQQHHLNQLLGPWVAPEYLQAFHFTLHPHNEVRFYFRPHQGWPWPEPIRVDCVLEELVATPQGSHIALRLRGPHWTRIGSFAEGLGSWGSHHVLWFWHHLGLSEPYLATGMRLDGDRLVWSLREEALAFLYDTSLAEAAGRNLPGIGHRKPIELLQVTGAKTTEGALWLRTSLTPGWHQRFPQAAVESPKPRDSAPGLGQPPKSKDSAPG